MRNAWDEFASVPEGDLALADHLEFHAEVLTSTVGEARARATAALSDRDDAWGPLAARINVVRGVGRLFGKKACRPIGARRPRPCRSWRKPAEPWPLLNAAAGNGCVPAACRHMTFWLDPVNTHCRPRRGLKIHRILAEVLGSRCHNPAIDLQRPSPSAL